MNKVYLSLFLCIVVITHAMNIDNNEMPDTDYVAHRVNDVYQRQSDLTTVWIKFLMQI